MGSGTFDGPDHAATPSLDRGMADFMRRRCRPPDTGLEHELWNSIFYSILAAVVLPRYLQPDRLDLAGCADARVAGACTGQVSQRRNWRKRQRRPWSCHLCISLFSCLWWVPRSDARSSHVSARVAPL